MHLKMNKLPFKKSDVINGGVPLKEGVLDLRIENIFCNFSNWEEILVRGVR